MSIELSSETQKNLERFRSHPYRSKRLKSYYSRYDKDNTYVEHDFMVEAVLRAQGISWEPAPRSVYKVSKLFDALTAYTPGNCHHPNPSEYLSSGIALAYKCFALPKGESKLDVLPLNPSTIDLITSKASASAGLTAYGCTKAAAKTRAIERGLQTLEGIKKPEPCLAFKRTQANDKTRLVWGYPYAMTAIEGLVAWPINQRFKGGCTPMAFAMPSGALGTKIRVASYHKEWAYSLDMSQYDASLSTYLINKAFDIIKTWFNLDQVEPVSGKTVGQIFKLVEDYFIHTPIVMPDGRVYYGKDHGVPSGSFFTQIVDSICNVIICGTISARFNLHANRREIFVLGDDLLFFSNRRVDLDLIARFAQQELGVKMHGSEKSAIFRFDSAIHFLGRDWENGIPDLDLAEVVKKMVYPESHRKYSRDKKEAERQCKLMLLSYSAQYRCAWSVAFCAVDPSDRNIHRGCATTDIDVYLEGSRQVEITPDHLSGLMRFMMREFPREKGDIPNSAMQFWL